VARRIEIELTSARPDGSWTWRAAGAREPRGVLEGGLLPGEAKAGDVLRAEAEFEIDGITIVSVLAPKASSRPEPQRIEIIGTGRAEGPSVTTQLVGRGDRRPGDRRRDRDEGRPRREREGARPNGRDATRPRREGPPAEDESTARPRDRTDRSERGTRTDGEDQSGRSERRGTGERRERPAGPRRSSEGANRGRPSGPGRGERAAQPAPGREASPAAPAERRARRFTPGRTHRQAILASLPPEQQPIAEQVLRGGIPAVRTALHLEREKAMAEGRPVPNTDQLVAMAESLLPRLKAAEWRDRAEAAAKDVDEISLRDLRSVVAGADMARDDETRALAAGLREALDRRVEALRTQWSDEIAKLLDDTKVVRALRLAARPPEPAARLDPALSERLSEAAGQALAPDAPAERWLAVLDAVAASPVRRSVKPAGLPGEASPEVRRVAHQQSGRVPALATMLGISMPPPPIATPTRKPPSRRRSRAGGPGGSRPEPGVTPTGATPGCDAATATGQATDTAGRPDENATGQTTDTAGHPDENTTGQTIDTAGHPDDDAPAATDQTTGTAGHPGDDAPAATGQETGTAGHPDDDALAATGQTTGTAGHPGDDAPAATGQETGTAGHPGVDPPAAGNQTAEPPASDYTASHHTTGAGPAPEESAEGVEHAVVMEELGESLGEG
jgi:hypothetical protein